MAKGKKTKSGKKSGAAPRTTRAKTADGTATVTRKVTKKGVKTKIKWERNRQPKSERDTITNRDIHKRLTEAVLIDKPKKEYRRKKDLPDPDAPRDTAVNRERIPKIVRIDFEEAQALERIQAATGDDFTTFVRKKIRECDPGPDYN